MRTCVPASQNIYITSIVSYGIYIEPPSFSLFFPRNTMITSFFGQRRSDRSLSPSVTPRPWQNSPQVDSQASSSQNTFPDDVIQIDDDTASTLSELTTAVSGETLAPSDDAPSIRAIKEAADDTAFEYAVAQLPQEHRIKIGRYRYILYNSYRPKKSKKKAWYWSHGIELIGTTKG